MADTKSPGRPTVRCASADAGETRTLPLMVLAVGLLLAAALRDAVADPVRDRSMAFFAAVDAADWPTVEELVADDFIGVDPRGGVSTRAEYLSDLRAIPPRQTVAEFNGHGAESARARTRPALCSAGV